MRVSNSLRNLESVSETLSSDLYTLVCSLRIIQIGIMLNLLILVVLLWSSIDSRFKPLRQKLRIEMSTNGVYLLSEGYAKCQVVKNLDNILEISRPVGVHSVRVPGTPSEELSLFSFSFWSFDADQCVSSEGFLVTFTPRDLEVIFCDYGFLTEYLAKGSFHFDFMERDPQLRGFTYSRVRSWFYPSTQKDDTGNECSACWLILAMRDPDPSLLNRTLTEYRGEALRHNLMMTRPQGILVALKPTEEDRIGTGRNTLRITDES